MRDDLIETLRDCANALGELLPRDHAYRKIIDKANRLLDRHDQSSSEQRAADALRDHHGRFASRYANVHDGLPARGQRPEGRHSQGAADG